MGEVLWVCQNPTPRPVCVPVFTQPRVLLVMLAGAYLVDMQTVNKVSLSDHSAEVRYYTEFPQQFCVGSAFEP